MFVNITWNGWICFRRVYLHNKESHSICLMHQCHNIIITEHLSCFAFQARMSSLSSTFYDLSAMIHQGLLKLVWTEGCLGQSSNPGLALAILKVRLNQNEFMKSSISKKWTEKFEGFLPWEFLQYIWQKSFKFFG